MALSVWKYPVVANDYLFVQMPQGAQPLHFDMQGSNHLCLWALVDTDQQVMRTFKFRMAGTGHPINDDLNLEFINTVLIHGGEVIFHFFRIRDHDVCLRNQPN